MVLLLFQDKPDIFGGKTVNKFGRKLSLRLEKSTNKTLQKKGYSPKGGQIKEYFPCEHPVSLQAWSI